MPFDSVGKTLNAGSHYFLPLGLRFLAVLAACLKFFAVGAPGSPGLRIFSPEPALIRRRLAAILAYKPRFLAGMAQNATTNLV